MKPCHFAVYSKMFENNSVMIDKIKEGMNLEVEKFLSSIVLILFMMKKNPT